MENKELDRLQHQVKALSKRVDQLEKQLGKAPEKKPVPKPKIQETKEVDTRRESWEQRIGGTWFLRLGVVAIIFALAFFLRYAFEQDWINEYGRVAIGFVSAILLLAAGEFFRHKRSMPRFGAGLSGAGIAAFYVTIYAGHAFYELFASTPAYGMMIAVTVLAVGLSLWYKTPSIAALGLLGGYLTPLLVGGEGNYLGLYTYVIILNLGVLAIIARQRWEGLTLISLVFTYILFGVGMALGYSEDMRLIFMLFLSLFHLFFLAGGMLTNLLQRQSRGPTIAGSIISSVLYVIFAAGILWEHDYILSAVMVGWGLLCMGQFLALRFWRNQDYSLANVMLVLSFAYVTVAIPVGLMAGWITAAWLVLALALVGLGLRLNFGGARAWGYLVLVMTYFRLAFIDLSLMQPVYWVEYTTPWASRLPLLLLVVAGSMGLTWLLYTSHVAKPIEKSLGSFFLVLANLVVLSGVLKEFSRYYHWLGMAEPGFIWRVYRNTAWSVTMGIHGLLLVTVGIWRQFRLPRLLGIGLLLVTVAKILMVDMQGVETIWRMLTFFGTGIILLLASYLYQHFVTPQHQEAEK